MRVTKKYFLCGVACALLTVMLLGLAACKKAPEVQIAEPSVTTKTTEPPVFIEPDLPEREINIKNYNVIGQWENTRVTANGEDSSYGPFRSQDFNTFTKWNPQAKSGYAGDPGIVYELERACNLNKVVFTFSGEYYFELYVGTDEENYTLVADIDRTNIARAFVDGICTLEGLQLQNIRFVKLIFKGSANNNAWVNLREVEFFESGEKNTDVDWMIPPPPETAVVVQGEVIGSWAKNNVNHGTNPIVNSFDNDVETKWNPQAAKGYSGNPGVIYTLDKPYDIKRIELTMGKLRHYFELYVSSDGKSYKRIANICTLNEHRAYSDGVCKLDGLNLQGVQYVKMIFTGREDNQTWVNFHELSLYDTGTEGLSISWMNPWIEKTLPIAKAELTGEWNKDNANHAQHPLTASYDGNLATKWNPAAKGSFAGDPGVIYTLKKAATIKRLELTFTHDHHYFDVYFSTNGTDYKKIASISSENALKAYGKESSLVCTLDGLNEENVQYIKIVFTGRVANTTWVNLVEFKALNTGKDGLDTSWMLPAQDESLKIISGTVSGEWLYDNVDHAQHPLSASFDGKLTSKWNPAAKGNFAGEPGVVYTLENAGTLKCLELTFTHDHHYFDLYVSYDGETYKKIAKISAENSEKAYGTSESLVCTLDGLAEENVQYIKLVFTGRFASTTWVNLVEIKALPNGTEGLDISWMLPEEKPDATEPDEPSDGIPHIVSHSLVGDWILGREGDPNVGPQLSYDGNTDTRWNPQASGNYAKEQGIVYTLDGWYDLESVSMTFYRENDMYFDLYGSADGVKYDLLAQVTAENAVEYYTDTVCTAAVTANTVKYLKVMFTGRSIANDFVNVYEVVVSGTETTEPESTEPEETEPEVTAPEITEPEITEPGVSEPQEKIITIIGHEAVGNWVNDQVWDNGSDDLNVGPQKSYDGDTNTKWNPQASGNYAKEQGIIYTLDGWYELETVVCTFSAADMYFAVYGSADGSNYTLLAEVTKENITELYSGATCNLDVSCAEAVKYIKLMFTGRANHMDFVNLHEVSLTGTAAQESEATEPEVTEPQITEPEATEPEQEKQPVAVQFTGFEVNGDWANDRIWDDGSNDLNTGPQLCCDGKTTTKWNPAVKSYTGNEGIVFTLDKLYDLQQMKLTFASGEVMYFKLYGSFDGVTYTPIADITSADTSMYSGGVCTLEDTAADKVKYIKLVFTGKSNNSTWINFYEFEITAIPCEELTIDN